MKLLALALVLIGIFVSGCTIPGWPWPSASIPPTATPTTQLRVLTDYDVQAEQALLEVLNSNNTQISPSNYPKVIGVYERNGLTLEEVYFCSDICPTYGQVYLVYKDVNQLQCPVVGGKTISDPAWGGYIGCEPKVQ